ncbi:YtpI family protein [Bacillus horti]|uniref:YtpI-like protein n=1 Tax=Caldalkalibacillus horti TaxID=77523 RepID=A0ABT9W417_9BACI|nr:YtpI family protein [Bacillus horti]MDQ0167995.1 hypothetical protein [Bacillus horti]
MDIVLFFVVILAAGFSIFYSFRGRSYKKKGEFDMMRFYTAKTNIAMGTMLIAMALVQLVGFYPEITGWRIGVGVVFLALGLFNFIMGIKYHRIFAAKVTNS